MIIKVKNKALYLQIISILKHNELTYYEVNEQDHYLVTSIDITNLLTNIDEHAYEIINYQDYYFVSKAFKKSTSFKVKDVNFNKDNFVIIGGPCAVESSIQMKETLAYLNKTQTDCLRVGLFKPRTSPTSFQGLRANGFDIINNLNIKMPLVGELTSINEVLAYHQNFDIIQIGARNMQNFELLKVVATINKPIILKRGFANTIKELLCSAEYLYLNGATQIILCERGLRTFENAYRNVLDLNGVAYLKLKTHLPIIVDPSHGTGDASLVSSLALASIMVKADGLMIETHYQPSLALSDGKQALNPHQYQKLIKQIRATHAFYQQLNNDEDDEDE
ncbi:MAG: 3-deoxy-7-phosphoheptulonate synthase [Bacilli bacterium]|nr:3-deoxy-7-phosphoheptulonate synthase [Bacilli bacterium]